MDLSVERKDNSVLGSVIGQPAMHQIRRKQKEHAILKRRIDGCRQVLVAEVPITPSKT